MSKITCRPRLRQRLRRGENGLVFVAAICLGLMVTSARGGSLDAPAGPGSAASAMYTLEDIYNVLNTHTTNVTKRTGGFTEPTSGPTSGTMHTLNDIMTLAKRAPVPKTGQTTSYATNDDGWYGTNLGVAWPNPRFTVVGASGTAATNQIRDNLTGLIWARNANLASNSVWGANGKVTWSNALEVISNSSSGVVNKVTYGGTNDWRLPNVQELHSLIAWQYYNPVLCNTEGTGQWTANNPFIGVQSGGSDYYWSSTMRSVNADYVWGVELRYGDVNHLTKTTTYYVWPVRGGQ